ncbi:nitrate- and nitrite sensing domain-containing protein [Nonomuraea sp. NPDC046570]|uniref:sensor histidine kinase n=1 Tax=Nonomuraea sp. NPDC046570 TaxID=3155255 RepID=UPI0033E2483E
MVPLVSLVALWGYAASTTTGAALNLLKVDTFWTGVINQADDLVDELQLERLASAERLDGVTNAPAALARQRSQTDKARKRLIDAVESDDTQAALTHDMKIQLAGVFAQVDRLGEIRRGVDDGVLTPTRLVGDYAAISDSVYRLYGTIALSTDVELYRQANGVIAGEQAQEILHREHTLIVAAGATLDAADRDLLARLDGNRVLLFDKARTDLDGELRASFDRLAGSPGYISLMGSIAAFNSASPPALDTWRRQAEPVLKTFNAGTGEAGDLLLSRMKPAGFSILLSAGIAGVIGLIAVGFSIVVSVRVGQVITKELARLRGTAIELAEVRLPRVVARLRRGERVDVPREAPPIVIGPNATSEVRDLATAFDTVQSTAVEAAIEQARLREGVSEALRNLARRSQSLLQRQLKLLDHMQSHAEDPEALENLFKLDHLTTRMRRHAEGLVLLSGGVAGRRWRGTIPIEDVLSGAAGQVEDYTRIRVYPMPECGVSGSCVADLMHLFAELMENATSFSSPGNEVSVRGEPVGRGYVVEIEDRGLGMLDKDREAINARLASPPEFDPSLTERLGFAVVGLLAARHGIAVTLKPSPYGGTTAVVLVPTALLEQLPLPVELPELVHLPTAAIEREASGGLPRRTRTTTKRDTEPAALTAAPATGQDLPRRVRQVNLPPKLKEPAPPPAEERSPEEARALLSSLQSGWQRGRQDSEQEGGSER